MSHQLFLCAEKVEFDVSDRMFKVASESHKEMQKILSDSAHPRDPHLLTGRESLQFQLIDVELVAALGYAVDRASF
jgi:hypothetical protein